MFDVGIYVYLNFLLDRIDPVKRFEIRKNFCKKLLLGSYTYLSSI